MGNEVEQKPKELEVVDIEAYAKAGKTPPKGQRYRIRVDKDFLVFDGPTASGQAILEAAAKKPPEQFMLMQKVHGGQMIPIQLEQLVDFTTPGVERFVTLPLDQREG